MPKEIRGAGGLQNFGRPARRGHSQRSLSTPNCQLTSIGGSKLVGETGHYLNCEFEVTAGVLDLLKPHRIWP
jgi:hypothetical protein